MSLVWPRAARLRACMRYARASYYHTVYCTFQAFKYFWQHTIENEKIEFNNTPFIVSQIQKFHCQFGKHYYKQKKSETSKRVNLQGTQKIGCTAYVAVHSITLYPDSPRGTLMSTAEKKEERKIKSVSYMILQPRVKNHLPNILLFCPKKPIMHITRLMDQHRMHSAYTLNLLKKYMSQ